MMDFASMVQRLQQAGGQRPGMGATQQPGGTMPQGQSPMPQQGNMNPAHLQTVQPYLPQGTQFVNSMDELWKPQQGWKQNMPQHQGARPYLGVHGGGRY